MRLFVNCSNCRHKIFITSSARIRQELPPSFQLNCLNCRKMYIYNPFNVKAELGLTTSEGAFLGGLLGLAFGGVGALAGAILGGALGRNNEQQDKEKVMRFNNS